MSPLLITRAAVTALVRVADEVVEPNTGFSAYGVGRHMAQQVTDYVQCHGLGYFPPPDYFREQGQGVDAALLTLLDELASYCATYSKRELRRCLSRAFSSVQVSHISATVYTMPQVRLRQPGRLEQLARHYAPNELRVELQLSSIDKGQFDGYESMVQQRLQRWAGPAFEALRVLSFQRLP